jgi:hypothetical protein
MSGLRLSVVLAIASLGGCTLTPRQQDLLERAPSPSRYLIGRSLFDNGVECRYSDGEIVRRLNVAASCP